jgi:hypothetical protein
MSFPKKVAANWPHRIRDRSTNIGNALARRTARQRPVAVPASKDRLERLQRREQRALSARKGAIHGFLTELLANRRRREQ